MPGFLSSREAFHPVFSLPPHKILSYSGKWAASQLTATDSYLLFLAGLHSTELLEWRVPVARSARTDAIVAQNMKRLFSVLSKLDVIKNPSFATPRYVISQETRSLENVRYWIDAWLESYEDFQEGYKSVSLNQQILRKERALERLIKNSYRSTLSYAGILADWAALAGEFPTFATSVLDPLTKQPLTCSQYWKSLIIQCGKREALWKVNEKDLQELIEHCELNIEAGTIYSHELMTYLRTAYQEITNPLGFGAPGLKGTPFTLLDSENASVETANLLAIVDSAPTEEPRIENYPTKLAYLKAKMAYGLALKQRTDSTSISKTVQSNDKYDI
jgi:hypothetical protein